MKKILLVLFSLFSIVCVEAQLSDAHYLPPLKQGGNNQAIAQQRFYLSTPETTAFSVQVFQGTNTTPVATITGLSNTNPQTYNLANGDNNITLVTNTNTGVVLNNSGLRFVASGGQRFYVNYRGRSSAQATSLTSKGRQALGNRFRWGGIPNVGNQSSLSNVVGIMATENGTLVQISEYNPDCEFRLQNDPDGIVANSLSITLNAGQTYVLEAVQNQAIANRDGHIGALITSNNPIAISNGYLNGGVLPGSALRDAGIDQPVPENVLGREYVFVRGSGSNETEFPIIIATRDDTDVFVAGSLFATINAGDYVTIPGTNYNPTSSGGNMYVNTSKEVYAYQNLAGSTAIQTIGLNFIAPVNCLLPDNLDNISDIRNVAGQTFNGGITIVASASTPNANIQVFQNGTPVAVPAPVPVIGTADWKTFNINGLNGNVRVQSTGPIAVGFIGVRSSAGIAGYFSGFDTVPVVDLAVTGGGCLPGNTIEETTGGFDAYQWFLDGQPITGATASSYTPPPTLTSGDFFVRVTKGTCTYDSAILTVYSCSPDLVLTKTANAGPYLEGETVVFQVDIASNGIDPQTNVVVQDILPAELNFVSATVTKGLFNYPNWTVGTMQSGTSETLEITATVGATAPGTTALTNTATVTSDQGDADITLDSPSATINITDAEIVVTKSDDAPADGSYDTVGEIVNYTVVVTNDGAAVLSNINVTDANADTITPTAVATLAPGQSVNFFATHAITQADINAGQIVNQATSFGTNAAGFIVEDLSDDPQDPANNDVEGDGEGDDVTITPIAPNPELTIVKTADDTTLVVEGQIITYTYVVTNTGNIIINDVTVSDVHSGNGSFSTITLQSTNGTDDGADNDVDALASGQTATFTATYTVIQQDIDDQVNITNTATANGTPQAGTLVPATDDEVVTVATADSNVELTKVFNPAAAPPYDTVGEIITYTFTVINTGNTTLTNVSVADTGVDGGIVTPANVASILPGDSATFTAQYTIDQPDIEAGSFTNTATVSADTPNIGVITDISDDPNNTANVDPEGDGEPDDPTVTPIEQVIAIELLKEADAATNPPYDTLGEIITYTFTVNNNSNVVLTNVVVADGNADSGSIVPAVIASLPPMSATTVTAAHTITQADINAGEVVNQATVTGITNTSQVATDMSDDPADPTSADDPTVVPIPQNIDITFEKTATLNDPNGDGFPQVGETITYTFTVANIGNTSITNVTVNDPNVTVNGGPIDLDPGDVNTSAFFATYTLTQADIDVGSFANQATLAAEDPNGNAITPILSDDPTTGAPDDPTITTLPANSDFTVTKVAEPAADGAYDEIGEDIVYTITVTNTGNTTLTGFVVADPNADTLTPSTIASLAPGASVIVVATHEIDQADLNAGSFSNQATVNANGPGGALPPVVSDDPNDPTSTTDATVVPFSITPELTLEKTSVLNNGPDGITQAGETITYTFTVRNTGNIEISGITIDDATIGVTGLPTVPATIPPGNSGVVTFNYTVTQLDIDAGSVSNQATTTAPDPLDPVNNPPITDTSDDPGTTPADDPTITIIDNTDTFTVEKIGLVAPDGAYDSVGEVITYEITITNTGNTTLSNITITDNNADTITPSTIASIAPGTSEVVIATHIITQADLDAGSVTNSASVSAQNPNGQPVGPVVSDDPNDPTSTTDPTVIAMDQTIGLVLLKTDTFNDQNGDGVPQAGETITYAFSVENTGNTTIVNVTIADPSITVNGGPIDLDAFETNTTAFTGTYTIVQADIDNGSFSNQATANGTDANGNPVSDLSDDPDTANPDDPTVTTLNSDAALELSKQGSWIDSNGDGLSQAGEPVNYIFEVMNTGNVTISGITIADPLPGITVSGGPITLAPGESDIVTFTATYALLQDDVNAGEVINQATASGTDPDGNTISDLSDNPNTVPANDATMVMLVRFPDIALFKTAMVNDTNGDGIPQAGETITYMFDVRNIGNVTLNNIVVTDPLVTVTGGPISLDPLGIDQTTFVGTYTITQADLDGGGVTNTAEVIGEDDFGGVITDISDFSDDPDNPNNIDLNGDGDPDDPTVTGLMGFPAMSIEKIGVFNDANGNGLAEVGETIAYTFSVTNTGNLTLNNITVSDPLVTVNGGPISLAPLAVDNTTFTASYVLSQADVDGGSISNQATATATDPMGNAVSDTSDDPNNPTNSDANGDGEPDDVTVTTLPQDASIAVVKTAVVNDDVIANGLPDVGETITYTIAITNTGNVTISNITVTDPLIPTPGSITLLPSETDNTTFVVNYTLTQADIDGGSITNQATATGSDPSGATVTDMSDDPNDPTSDDDPTVTTLTNNAEIAILKTATFTDENNDGIAQEGETITYAFEVSNLGNVTLTNVTVSDPNVAVSGGPISLAPGTTDSATFTATYTLLQSDIDAGSFSNQATVSAEDPNGTVLNDISDDPTTPALEDPTVLQLPANSGISLLKATDPAADGAYDMLNEVITYTITVTNTGNTTLANVVVTDPNADAGSISPALIASLAPNTSVTVVAAHTITQTDLNNGAVSNQASVDGTDPFGTTITDNSDDPNNPADNDANGDGEPDDITVTILVQNAMITLLKESVFDDQSNDGLAQVGETITYTFTVTNTGNQTVSAITINDPMVAVSGGPITLQPTDVDNTTFTATYTLTQADVDAGQFTNQATASGSDPNGNVVSDTSDDPNDPTSNDDATITTLPQNAEIVVLKTSVINDDLIANGVVDEGETITYTISVENTGNVTISNITVTDPLIATPGTITLTPGELDNTTFVVQYVITQADINNGGVTNQATASGSDPTGTAVLDTSDDPNDPTSDDDPTVTVISFASEMVLTKTATFNDENNDGIPQEFETIGYIFEVSNTGNTTLTNVQISDPNVAVMGGPIVLNPGQTDNTTFTATYVIQQTDIDAGSFSNQATATAEDPNGGPVSDLSDDPTTVADNDPTVTVLPAVSSLSMTKATNPAADGAYDTDGEIINYTIVVTNTGNTTLSNIAITDGNADPGSITPASIVSLAPGISATVTAQHTITLADINSGSVANQATAQGVDPFAAVVNDDSDDPNNATNSDNNGDGEPDDITITPIVQNPLIEILKVADAPADGSYDTVGEVIAYTITVNNPGNVTLSNIVITDPGADAGSITPATIPTLLPMGSVNVTAQHTITQADIDAGSFSNQASISAEDPNGTDVIDLSDDPNDPTSDDDATVTTIDQTTAFSVTKVDDSAADGAYDMVGEQITYTIVVSNDGNTTISNLIVNDPNADAGSINPMNIATLAPGASVTVTATHTLTITDFNTGTVTNQATVTANGPDGNALPPVVSDDPDDGTSNVDPTITPLVLNPELTITKVGTFQDDSIIPAENGDGIPQVGETIAYVFVVTNTGNQTITNITVSDPLVTTNGGPITLDPGQSDNTTFTASYSIILNDVNNGQVTNQATANGLDPGNNAVSDLSDDPTTSAMNDVTVTPLAQFAELSILKTGVFNDENGDGFAQENETVTYVFSITNTGNVTITNIGVTDPIIPVPAATISLDPGEVDDTTFTTTINLTQLQVDAGVINNQATASGLDPNNATVDDLSDDPTNPADVDANGDGDPDDVTVTLLPANPMITVEKVGTFVDLNGDNIPQPGETIQYAFTVTNTGTVTLDNIFVTDIGVPVNGNFITLAPTQFDATTFTASYILTQDDINAGSFTNQATVSATDPAGNTITDLSDDPNNPDNVDPENDGEPDDPTVTDLLQVNDFIVEKITLPAVDGAYDMLGEAIQYEITVTNTGNTTLNNFVISDDNADPGSISPNTIAEILPGDDVTATAAHTITQDDLNTGSVTNTASVVAEDPNGDPVGPILSDDPNTPAPGDATVTPLVVFSELLVTKTGVFQDENSDMLGQPNETIVYTFEVTNTGNQTVTDITISDPIVPVLGGPITLLPGETDTMTFAAVYAITQGDINNGEVVNQASVEGLDPNLVAVTDDSDDPNTATANDPTIVPIPTTASLSVLKVGTFNDENNDGLAQVNETVTYTFSITNTGNVDLTDIALSDPLIPVPNTMIDLGAGETDTTTFTTSISLTQTNINAGEILNQATATGFDPMNLSVEDDSDDPNNPADVDNNGDNEPDDVTVTVLPQQPALEVLKTAVFNDENGDGLPQDNETISYAFTVTNTGNVTIENIDINDPLVPVAGGLITLDPGQSNLTNFTATYAIQQSDIDNGSFTNQANVFGTTLGGVLVEDLSDDPNNPADVDTEGDTEPDDPTVVVLDQVNNIISTKAEDSAPDGAYDELGEVITYSISVINTGNTTLTDVTITDANADAGSIVPAVISVLLPGETILATAAHTITQDDINLGSVTNTAVAEATTVDGTMISDDSDDPNNTTNIDPDNDGDPDDPTVTIIVQTIELDITKATVAAPDGAYDTLDEVITYTIEITNTGNTTVTNVVVTDANANSITPAVFAEILPGVTVTAVATHIITQADIDAGEVINTAFVAGEGPQGQAIGPIGSDDPNTSAPDDPTVTPIIQTFEYDVTKAAAIAPDGSYDMVGEQIEYSIVISNNGNTTLQNIIVTDPNADPGSISPSNITTLAPQTSITVMAVHTITQDDLDFGSVTNVATVSADRPDGTTLPVVVSDDPATTPIDDPTVVILDTTASLEITKAADLPADGSYDTVGEVITYEIVVTNAGNVTLSDIIITDPNANSITPSTISELTPGATLTAVATHIITQDDIDAGEVINTAFAEGIDPQGNGVGPVASDDPTTPTPDDATVVVIEQLPAFDVTKVFNPAPDGAYDTVGELILYDIVVSNTGNTTLFNIVVVDDNATITGGSPIAELAPGDTALVTAEHAITQAELDAGEVINVAVTTAENPQGDALGPVVSDDPTTVENDDATITPLVELPRMEVTKAVTSVGPYDTVGQAITYDISVTNIGNVTLTNVVIGDPNANSVTPSTFATIVPGETVVGVAVHLVTQDDIDAGEVINQATVTGFTMQGTTIMETSDDPNDPTNVDPDGDGDPDDPTVVPIMGMSSFIVEKQALTPTYAAVGDVIQYEISILNTGEVLLSNVTIDEPNATIISGLPIADIPAGESVTLIAEHVVTLQDILDEFVANQATVMATDLSGNVLTVLSDDINDPTDEDVDGDGNPDDITFVFADSDGDGVNNIDDLDDDNDGIVDTEEMNGNPNLDTDGDGILDRLDLDSDGDGVNDLYEAGHDGVDTDGDGRLDSPVGVDGIPNEVQSNPDDGLVNYDIQDTDGDGVDDFQDTDDDGDNVPTSVENPNPDGNGNPSDAQDTDGDGIPDYLDEDDDGDGVLTIFEDYTGLESPGDGDPTNDDTDGDGIPDYLDIDDDNDGILTADENPDINGDGNPEDAEDANDNDIRDYLEVNNNGPGNGDGIVVFDLMSPNGDGLNDVFIIKGIENFPSNEVKIFNRWGVLVWETLGYGQANNFFRGESIGRATIQAGEQLPVGTYFYIIEYERPDGSNVRLAGSIYINR